MKKINKPRMHLLATCLLATISSATYAQPTISDLQLKSNLISGFPAEVSFAIKDLENQSYTAMIGLKLDTTEIQALKEAGDIELNDAIDSKIDVHLASVNLDTSDGQIIEEVTIPWMDIENAAFKIVVELNPALETPAQDGVVSDEETLTTSTVFYSDADYPLIVPSLPNLEISTSNITGDNGYTISKTTSESIELNLELLSRALPTSNTIATEFYLNIPGSGRMDIDVVDSANGSWLLQAECESCDVIGANQNKGASLSLALNDDLKSALQGVPTGTTATLEIVVDEAGNINEWDDNKSDNQSIIPLFIKD